VFLHLRRSPPQSPATASDAEPPDSPLRQDFQENERAQRALRTIGKLRKMHWKSFHMQIVLRRIQLQPRAAQRSSLPTLIEGCVSKFRSAIVTSRFLTHSVRFIVIPVSLHFPEIRAEDYSVLAQLVFRKSGAQRESLFVPWTSRCAVVSCPQGGGLEGVVPHSRILLIRLAQFNSVYSSIYATNAAIRASTLPLLVHHSSERPR
jgi:hypothetical protein